MSENKVDSTLTDHQEYAIWNLNESIDLSDDSKDMISRMYRYYAQNPNKYSLFAIVDALTVFESEYLKDENSNALKDLQAFRDRVNIHDKTTW
jgi:vacuolar-type H+-ATPase subunit B/Vma2